MADQTEQSGAGEEPAGQEGVSSDEIGKKNIVLGGNIELSGFGSIDGASMIIVKKIVGSYARRFSEITKKFELLALTIKVVHQREKSEKYELHARVMDNGSPYAAEAVDRNLFFAIDSVLKKVEQEIRK